MNKNILAGALALSLIPATNGFAQKIKIPKRVNPAKLERTVNQQVSRLVPQTTARLSGVYIPAGTTFDVLERKVVAVAQKANIKLNRTEVSAIASDPQRLAQFQEKAGIPLFEGRPLPYKEGLKVLNANQEKFTQARATGKYETAWTNYIKENLPAPLNKGIISEKIMNAVRANSAYVNAIYDFYVKYIGTENLPRVRQVGFAHNKYVVCEIPVDGLKYIDLFGNPADIVPNDVVVLGNANGPSRFIYRDELFSNDPLNIRSYRIIK